MLPCTPCLTAGRVPPPPPLTCNVRLRSPERKTVSSAEGSVEGASVALAGVEATTLAAPAQESARWSTVAMRDQGAARVPLLELLPVVVLAEEAAGRMGMRSREAGCSSIGGRGAMRKVRRSSDHKCTAEGTRVVPPTPAGGSHLTPRFPSTYKRSKSTALTPPHLQELHTWHPDSPAPTRGTHPPP